MIVAPDRSRAQDLRRLIDKVALEYAHFISRGVTRAKSSKKLWKKNTLVSDESEHLLQMVG